MAKLPTLKSPDGRVFRKITSEDELEAFKAQGYTEVGRKASAEREPINSGAEGQRRARQSSTTEGSERNSGSTTPTN